MPLSVAVQGAETGGPIIGARVTVITDRIQSHPHFCATDYGILGPSTVPADIDAITGPAGSVRVGVARGDRVEILVHPPGGSDVEPLVGVRAIVEIGDGTGPQEFIARLPRGRWVSGTVIDDLANRPIEGAVVHWGREGAAKPEWRDDVLVGRDALTRTGPDGRFRIAVLPGACSLRVYGPTLDYPATHAPVPGAANSTLFAHAITRLDVAPDCGVPPVRIVLSRGSTVVGRVEQREKVTPTAFALSSGRVSPVRPYACLTLPVRDNQFSLPGCRPGLVARVYFLDPAARAGGVADVSTTAPAPDVRLAACGTIRFRVLGEDGVPKNGQDIGVSLLVERDRQSADEPVADAQPVEWFDSVNYPTRPKTDVDGWAELPALIPGARYAIAVGSGRGKVSLGRFTVSANETVTLPDVVLAESGDSR